MTVTAAVAAGVDAGAMIVIWPSSTVTGIATPPVSSSRTLESVRSDVPSATAPKTIVASVPVPAGPGWLPVLSQPKATLVAVTTGPAQMMVRPLEPRNVPLVTLTKVTTAGS